MDIYTLIKKDHDEAKVLIEKINTLGNAGHLARVQVFAGLCDAVTAHNNAETDTFYVALEQHRLTRGKIHHSRREHDEANDMLDALRQKHLTPQEWERRFAEFQRALLHHIHEEETVIFDEARQVLSPNAARQLAGIMQELKEKKLHFAA